MPWPERLYWCLPGAGPRPEHPQLTAAYGTVPQPYLVALYHPRSIYSGGCLGWFTPMKYVVHMLEELTILMILVQHVLLLRTRLAALLTVG